MEKNNSIPLPFRSRPRNRGRRVVSGYNASCTTATRGQMTSGGALLVLGFMQPTVPAVARNRPARFIARVNVRLRQNAGMSGEDRRRRSGLLPLALSICLFLVPLLYLLSLGSVAWLVKYGYVDRRIWYIYTPIALRFLPLSKFPKGKCRAS